MDADTDMCFSVLRNTKWWKDGSNKDHGDNMKDTMRAAITFSFTTAKDAMKPEPASGAAMSAQLLVLVRHFKTSLTESSTQTFSGSEKGLSHLETLMAHGKLLDATPTGKLDMEDRSKHFTFSVCILSS